MPKGNSPTTHFFCLDVKVVERALVALNGGKQRSFDLFEGNGQFGILAHN